MRLSKNDPIAQEVVAVVHAGDALNVAAGLLLPAAVLGIGRAMADALLVASWYTVMTVLLVGFAYLHRGVRLSVAALLLACYLAFMGTVVATA